jgi:hypothetical protein
MLEIPVTTMPVFKAPFHLSYLLFLSRFSGLLMSFYLNCAIYLCKMTGTAPSFLLHPLDLIGGDKLTALSFFPGMGLASEEKSRAFCKVIKTMARHFDLSDMSTHANFLLKTTELEFVNAK